MLSITAYNLSNTPSAKSRYNDSHAIALTTSRSGLCAEPSLRSFPRFEFSGKVAVSGLADDSQPLAVGKQLVDAIWARFAHRASQILGHRAFRLLLWLTFSQRNKGYQERADQARKTGNSAKSQKLPLIQYSPLAISLHNINCTDVAESSTYGAIQDVLRKDNRAHNNSVLRVFSVPEGMA